MVLTGVLYGITPGPKSLMSWSTPFVLSMLIVGTLLLAGFILIERFSKWPMFKLELFLDPLLYGGKYCRPGIFTGARRVPASSDYLVAGDMASVEGLQF